MKKILVYGMTDNPGGIETYLLNFFRRVQDRDVHLDFVTDFPQVAYAAEFEKGGARIYYIPAKSRGLVRQWRAMHRILRKHPEYQTVYFNVLDAGGALTMLVPFLMGRRVVVHSHNSATDKKRLHRLCRPLLKIVSSHYAACSKVAADYMFGNTKLPVLIIPNVIDTAAYAYNPQLREAKRSELGVQDKLVICHVGRISNQKNPFGLIDIFSEIHRKDSNAVLLSVGDGELADEFHVYIQKKQLGDAVHCLGRRSDVAEILQAADVFLLPSFYEGLGIVAIEAQAAGLPCVISNSIPPEVICTDHVTSLSLKLPPAKWADEILRAARLPREDTSAQLKKAGFDISCSAQMDRRLIRMFR